jgi:type IV pilus assembly protein PilM
VDVEAAMQTETLVEMMPAAAGSVAGEVAQAVSVAAAYFEDTLETAPAVVFAAGTLGAEALTGVLDGAQVGPVAVEEMVGPQVLGDGASSAGSRGGVPLGWLAGVRGALAN